MEIEIVQQYRDWGYDPMPLRLNSKVAYVRDWTNQSQETLWRVAKNPYNVGLRCDSSNGLAVLDADVHKHPETANNLRRFLEGLGLKEGDYPVVETFRRGYHFYISLLGNQMGNSFKWKPEVGEGEFRFGHGAYVVAPPSTIDGGQYRRVSGDFNRLPPIEMKDILPFLKSSTQEPTIVSESVDPVVVEPACPPHVGLISDLRITNRIRKMLNGEFEDGKYRTRSERDQALAVQLVLQGFADKEVLHFFEEFPCSGKYAEKRTKSREEAQDYVAQNCRSARQYSEGCITPAKVQAEYAFNWALDREWTGRTRGTDRAVFIAMTAICYRTGKSSFRAAIREVAEMTGLSDVTVQKAINRLVESGSLTRFRSRLGEARRFGLNISISVQHSEKRHYTVMDWYNFANHDAFRRQGLGKVAFDAWFYLQHTPYQPTREIASKTGRDRRSVEKVLQRMSRIVDASTGEMLWLVEKDVEIWRCNPDADLDHVARILGTAGAGEKQRQRHVEERERYQKWRQKETEEVSYVPIQLVKFNPPRDLVVPATSHLPGAF